MKKILVLAAAIALVSSTAFAAGTATLNVTATVTATCSITGGTLAFGAIDPLVGAAVGANATGVTVTCSNGTGFTVSDNSAANPLANGASTIPFTLGYIATGTGTGAAAPLAISGTIAANTYDTALAGAYTSSVTLTVTP